MTSPEDDRTVIKPAARSRRAGHPLDERVNALPPGSRLGEFEILAVIGEGGFGIVYEAQDHILDRHVAIKEYMPAALAMRTQAMQVEVISPRHQETFAAGRRSFVNEARLLAQFDHPSLLKVHRYWEDHGTAYMAMPYYAGETLAATLHRRNASPNEAELRALLAPLLDALELMHAAHCFHRDIAPDNILLQPDGRPLLLDFGAARRVIAGMTQAPTVILKTGYAPVEQYGEVEGMTQGAWTDLYALGSVVHFAITGRTPPQAVARFLSDKHVPLSRSAAGRYGANFLDAIDRTLAVSPSDRPQSAAALRELLARPDPAVPKPSMLSSPTAAQVARVALPSMPASAPTPVLPTPVLPTTMPRVEVPPVAPKRRPARGSSKGNWRDAVDFEIDVPGSALAGRKVSGQRRRAVAVAAVVAVVALGFAVWWMRGPSPGIAPAIAPATDEAPVSESDSGSASQAASVPAAAASPATPSALPSASPASSSIPASTAVPAIPSAASSVLLAVPATESIPTPAASVAPATPSTATPSAVTPPSPAPEPAASAPVPSPAPSTTTPPGTASMAPPTSTSAPAPKNEAASRLPRTPPQRPTTTAPPRAATPPASPASTPPSDRLPSSALARQRCMDIIAHVTLGEPLSATDREFMSKECRP